MNLFILDKLPQKAALYHLDKHCVKQVLETYQMLGSAVIRHGARPEQMPLTQSGRPLRGGYKNHPCTKWVGETNKNFAWAVDLGLALAKEYTYRYGRIHACEAGIHKLKGMSNLIPEGDLTPFAVAINEEQTCRQNKLFDSLSVYDKYRQYYIHDKAYMAKWTRRDKPEWFIVDNKTNA